MSDARFGSGTSAGDSAASNPRRDAGGSTRSAGGDTAGSLLRAARESQGLHIAALAAAIKVSPRKLDALENNRIEELPDATFARALAQTLCRTLKVDAGPVLALLPAAGSTSIEPVSRTAHAPFRERSGRDAPGFASGAIRPMVWAAVLLMLAAVVVFLLPDSVWKTASSDVAVEPPLALLASAGDAASAVPPMDAAVHAFGAAAPAAANTSPTPLSTRTDTDVTLGAAASLPPLTAVETVFSAPAATVPASSAAAGSLQLSTSQASWVEVRDGSGQVLLSRTVQPGESVGLDGPLPMRLTIGNAAYTQVGFRGQAVDLAPSIRDNVARLELQ